MAIVVVALAFALSATAQSLVAQISCKPGVGRMVLIHGIGHAFTISAPNGWVAQAGYPDQPFPALLYPEGQSWRDAPAVMYVNTVLPKEGGVASIASVMQGDSAKFGGEYPLMRMDTLPTTHTADGRIVRFRKFAGGGYLSVDLVGYVAERTVTPLVVLSARSEADLTGSLPAFRLLLQSYHYVARQAAMGRKLPCGAA